MRKLVRITSGNRYKLFVTSDKGCKASFVEGMSELLEGEVSLVSRKIILIHGQNPGFYYLEDKRFK